MTTFNMAVLILLQFSIAGLSCGKLQKGTLGIRNNFSKVVYYQVVIHKPGTPIVGPYSFPHDSVNLPALSSGGEVIEDLEGTFSPGDDIGPPLKGEGSSYRN